MPSRDFLVQQSVLNAISKLMPTSVELMGAGAALAWCQKLWGTDEVPLYFQASIAEQFQALSSREAAQ